MDSSRQLIIDGQVLQTLAWDRGMGKYSLSLLTELFNSSRVPPKTTILFNKNVPADKKMLDRVEHLLSKPEIIYLDFLLPSAHHRSDFIQNTNKKVVDKYIDSTAPTTEVDYLVLSLFLDQVFVVFPTRARKLLLFYDLIPYLFANRYSKRINYEDYLIRFRSIFEADLIFTISQTVADDLGIYLGIPQHRLHNINGASIDRSKLKPVRPDTATRNKFILMISGDELRKNNTNAVKGFADFNARNDNQYDLVITSNFTAETTRELSLYSDHLVFTGNVSEEELKWLYEKAEFICFPSEYEGLGLPILEAISEKKKIACSDIPAFKEISPDAFYYFDPAEPESISAGLTLAVSSTEDLEKYRKIQKNYTWRKTAAAFHEGYLKVLGFKSVSARQGARAKPRIAVFTPHPSGYSAIGKVVSETHASLSELFDVDYYFDYQEETNKSIRPDFLSFAANCYDAKVFNQKLYSEYTAVIYNVGNSDYHLNTIKNALYLRGYVILHDTNLKGAYGELRRLGWVDENRLLIEDLISKKIGVKSGGNLASLINNQKAVVVHSNYAKGKVSEVMLRKKAAIKKAELPVFVPTISSNSRQNRKKTIGLAGILADIKGLPIIEDLATHPALQHCSFKVFGFSFINPETLDRLAGIPNLEIYRDPTDFEFQTHLSSLDVLINYRAKYQGETSLTVLEAMRYGVQVIVNDIGWYSELPDNTVHKAESIQELISNVISLTGDDAIHDNGVASNARKYILSKHSHEGYVLNLKKLIDAQQD